MKDLGSFVIAIEQDKARLLIADYYSRLGYGAKAALWNELEKCFVDKEYSQKAFNNWMAERTVKMQAQNYLVLLKFLRTEKFRSVVKWGDEIDDAKKLREEKNNLEIEKDEVRKRVSVSIEKIHKRRELDDALVKYLDGYWEVKNPSFEESGRLLIAAIKLSKEVEIGKIVIVDVGGEKNKIELGLFVLSDVLVGEEELMLHGKSWSKKSSHTFTDFDLMVSKKDVLKKHGEIQLFHEMTESLNLQNLRPCDDIREDIKAVLDIHLDTVLPHYE